MSIEDISVQSDRISTKITGDSQIWVVTCLVISVIALSFAPILVRCSETELGPYGTVFNRFWITGLLLVLGKGIKTFWNRISASLSDKIHDLSLEHPEEVYTLQDIAYLILAAILEAACHVTWAWSLTETSVANSNLLHNTTPIFTTLGGWLLFNQSFSFRCLSGIALSILGTLVLSLQDFQLGLGTWIGDSIALLSALFYASAFLLVGHLRAKFSTTTILLWMCTWCTLLLMPFTLLLEDSLLPTSSSTWFAVTGLASLCTIIGTSALIFTLKHFTSSFVSLVMLLEPFIAACLAWFFFAEQLSLFNGLIFIIVLYGIYLVEPASKQS